MAQPTSTSSEGLTHQPRPTLNLPAFLTRPAFVAAFVASGYLATEFVFSDSVFKTLNSGIRAGCVPGSGYFALTLLTLCFKIMAGYNLQPFHGKTDFSIWQQKMKGILIQQKVFKAIDGKYADTVSDDKKLENDEYAYSSIILNLSDSVIRKVDTNLTCLKTLMKHYDFTKLIQDIKLTRDKNIDDYSPIVLLNAIPETYGDVEAAIKYGDNVNLETVVSGLKNKEMDLKTNKPSQNQNENVRHVPDLAHNLISCSALEEEGLEGKWGKGVMKIMKGSHTVFKAERKRNLYVCSVKSPSVPLSGKIPECIWTDSDVNLSSLRIFGCSAFALSHGDKLDPRSQKYVFIGYPDGVKGYRLWLRSQPASPSITLVVELQNSLSKTFEMKDLGDA
ncbi:hypothetical protein Sango_2475300 [Sesamum angolense]|uniref:Retroviral polymerase SH3-like domain-containing protein n=1 Tax=Sesamum angolense TaxID=2727404 RepID=A0AAE1W3I1_9LAMI|nr:hypothetical protein Sango_2475300 [Sesamum angolense]